MSPIGSMIIVGVLALGGSLAVVATFNHFTKPSPQNSIRKMRIVPFEEKAEPHGDGAWITESAKFPSSGVLREPEPRGM